MKRILVIDDDEQFRPMVTRMLQQAGYKVVDANDGMEGIRLFRQEPADLVITDIFMPKKEGLELHKEFPDLKIIAMSGGSSRTGEFSTLPYARQFGARETLSKPFRRGELLNLVQKVLDDE